MSDMQQDQRNEGEKRPVEVHIDESLSPTERLKALRALVKEADAHGESMSLRAPGSDEKLSLAGGSLEDLTSALGYGEGGLPEDLQRLVNDTRVVESVKEIYRNIGPATVEGAEVAFDQLLVLNSTLEEMGIAISDARLPVTGMVHESDAQKLLWEYLVQSHDVITSYDKEEMKFTDEKAETAYSALSSLRRAIHEYTNDLDPEKIDVLRQELKAKAAEYGQE